MIKWNLEIAKREFENKGLILLETNFKSVDTSMECIAKCGHKKKLSISNLLIDHGLYCRKCSYKVGSSKRKYDYEYVKNYFENEGCKLLSTEYIKTEAPLIYIATCGHENKISFTKFKNEFQGRLCRSCGRPKKEKHFNYNPNITDEERIKNRDYNEIIEWRFKIFQRDCYTCQCCRDKTGNNLNAHHLDGYNWCKEKRLDLNNGITLCETCHTDFHKIYGYGNNTKEQFDEWLQSIKYIKQAN